MYLMLQHRMGLRRTYNYIKCHRPQIAVNDGFKLQCALLEVKEFGCSSVASPKAGRDWDFYKWRSVRHEYRLAPDDGGVECCLLS